MMRPAKRDHKEKVREELEEIREGWEADNLMLMSFDDDYSDRWDFLDIWHELDEELRVMDAKFLINMGRRPLRI